MQINECLRIICFPGMPCMKRVYKDKYVGVGTLVSSQEQRAAVVPQINRLSTAGFVPLSLYMGLRLFVLSIVQDSCPRCFGGREGRLFPGRKTPSASSPAPPRPAPPPRRASPRPDPPVICPGFGFDRFHEINDLCVCPQVSLG